MGRLTTLWPASGGQAIGLAAAVAVVIAGKAGSIAAFGGLLLEPDTRYVDTARAMIAGNAWFWDGGLQDEAIPHALWKTVGYSGVIALFILTFGDAWHWWLFGFQAALSIGSGLYLYVLARKVGLEAPLAILVFLLHQGSLPVSTDAFVATNSLDGSLVTILLSDFGVRYLQGRLIRPTVMFVYAILLWLCYLMRLTYEYWVLLFILAFVAAAFGTRSRLRPVAISLLVFCVVFFGATSIYKGWNYARTGYFISSTGGQTAYVFGTIRTARSIAPDDPASVIAGDGPPARAVREALSQPSSTAYDLTKVINRRLFNEFGLNAVEIHQAAGSRFWRLVSEHPIDWFLKVWLRNGGWDHQGMLFVGAIPQYDVTLWWRSVNRHGAFYEGWRKTFQEFMETRDWRVLTPEAVFQGGLRVAHRLAGLAALTLLLTGTLVSFMRWFRSGRTTPRAESLLAIYGALYFLTACMFAVHFVEIRYLSSVIGIGIVAMVAHAKSLTQWFVARLSS